jgi:hypothetical protein
MPGWLKRFIRVSLALVAAGAAAKYGDNQYYMVAVPLLSAASKKLRDGSVTGAWDWLPF